MATPPPVLVNPPPLAETLPLLTNPDWAYSVGPTVNCAVPVEPVWLIVNVEAPFVPFPMLGVIVH